MYRDVSRLILFGNRQEYDILKNLAGIFRDFDNGLKNDDLIISEIYAQINKLLTVATQYDFNENLWQDYLTFLIITDENPFSITCEKIGAGDGTVNSFALNDCAIFKKLFDYDFSRIEGSLDIDCFSKICNYKSIEKPELMYNKNIGEKVTYLRKKLANAHSPEEFFNNITTFYKDFGVGMFGLNKAFRISGSGEDLTFIPINNMENVVLSDLIGYERQKKKLVDNTLSFVEGKKSNNCLLYGGSGTGKSTSVKAVVNEFYGQGLRMIEIYKHQFKELSNVITRIKKRNYRFIIYMDDLSFEEFEIEYKYLKAVIEGGVEEKPENVLIYATSNRRHLIKETWKDKNDMESINGIHVSDTIEEKMSLYNRFGITINYGKPTPKEYIDIVFALADRNNITMEREELRIKANRWEIEHGGISGRTASQFINYLLSSEEKEEI